MVEGQKYKTVDLSGSQDWAFLIPQYLTLEDNWKLKLKNVIPLD